jgi:hypothetical protein
VVWEDWTPGAPDIYYKRSTDGGATWTTKRLTYNSGWSYTPVVSVDSNDRLHVVWRDNTPTIAEIYYKKSTDEGVTWFTKRLTYTSNNSWEPAIAIDTNNHIHVVWYDSAPGNSEIHYTWSTDAGTTWSTKRLTWTSGSSASPVIAVDSNNHLHVFWHDYTPITAEIYYKKSTNGGTTWSTKRLTWSAIGSVSPSLTVDSTNHIHVVWRGGGFGNLEIYYKRSTDGGANWSDKRLTWNSGDSQHPAIAASTNNHIHVIWWDDTPGNREIYYRRGNQ